VIAVIQQTLGEVPMVEAEQRRLAGDQTEEQKQQQGSAGGSAAGSATEGSGSGSGNASNKVTSDGTYATQSAYSLAP